MLNPALLSPEQVDVIKKAFSLLKNRGIVDFELDMEDTIRQKFDLTVLRAFGIEDYYSTILNSIRSMRKTRKAVNQKTIAAPLIQTVGFDLDNSIVTMAAEDSNRN